LRPDITAVNVRKGEVKARIPDAHSFSLLTIQGANLNDITAKTGWADLSAVGAREATFGYLSPVGVL
jgi:hypothetical protein